MGRKVRLVRSPVTDSPDERRHMSQGDGLTFGLLLMGRATEYLPYVVYAVSEMARRGLGASRTPFELTEVAMIDESGNRNPIYRGETQRVIVPDSATMKLSDLIGRRLDRLAFSANTLKLKFLTPARIRVEGDLQLKMSFELLARNLLRRISTLAMVHGRTQLELDYRGLIALAADVSISTFALRWFDLERYSNRQRTKMNLGGFIGEVEYTGKVIKEFIPLIAAGELLNVGTGTSFGLGRYEIVA